MVIIIIIINGKWNNLQIIQTMPEQRTWKVQRQGDTKNSHTEHCAHTSEMFM
jgi:hypothetical protein